jgi:hypothetical protein
MFSLIYLLNAAILSLLSSNANSWPHHCCDQEPSGLADRCSTRLETVLPDGRNFGQKAQKGPEINKVGRKIWWLNFARLRPKMAEKGPEKV